MYSLGQRSMRATQQQMYRRGTRSFSMQPYIAQLRQRYPSADVPSLVGSFIVLHELTAVVPLFAGFWACRALGLGTAVVAWAAASSDSDVDESSDWVHGKLKNWVQQGQLKAEKIGRHYGVFGYEKRSKQTEAGIATESGTDSVAMHHGVSPHTESIGGDVANLVAAYVGVKVSNKAWPALKAVTPAYRRPLRYSCSYLCAS